MKNLTLILFTLFFLTQNTHARSFGIGAILGSPTGISGKYNIENQYAFDGAVAYGRHELVFYVDYLKHFPKSIKAQNEFISSLNPYIGIGPMFVFGNGDRRHHRYIKNDDDDFSFGGRVPLGVEWLAPDFPLGLSLEIAPGLSVIPETDAFIQGGLAIRYYFR